MPTSTSQRAANGSASLHSNRDGIAYAIREALINRPDVFADEQNINLPLALTRVAESIAYAGDRLYEGLSYLFDVAKELQRLADVRELELELSDSPPKPAPIAYESLDAAQLAQLEK